jgi:hypothetical protein
MRGNLAVLFFELGVLVTTLPLFGDERRVQVTNTERISFAPGGIIRVNGSYGSLNVEGWDRPEVEIAVVKSTQKYYESKQREKAATSLERVRVTAERHSDTELAISTSQGSGVLVDYEIHVPRDSRLVIHHGTGHVLVSNVTGDIEATGHRGDILLMLPGTGAYAIDAKTKFGVVTSDFAGDLHRRRYLIGERFSSPPASHRLYLRMGFGGITIKSVPQEAEPPAVVGTNRFAGESACATRQAFSPMSLSFCDAQQSIESIVAHALLRAASALVPTPGLHVRGGLAKHLAAPQTTSVV